MEFDYNVLGFEVAGLVQASTNRGGGTLIRRLAAGIPDHRQRWLLRMCRDWARHRAAEQRDELAPFPNMGLPPLQAFRWPARDGTACAYFACQRAGSDKGSQE
jgi:hypothetical protein